LSILKARGDCSVPDWPQLHAAIKEPFDQWQKRLMRLLIAEGWQRAKGRGCGGLCLGEGSRNSNRSIVSLALGWTDSEY
jgi:hypothetical protein